MSTAFIIINPGHEQWNKIIRRHRGRQRNCPLPAPAISSSFHRKNEVFFVDFPIVQVDVMMISRGTPQFNLEEHLMREFYNEYFGFGMSSIVFQEIPGS